MHLPRLGVRHQSDCDWQSSMRIISGFACSIISWSNSHVPRSLTPRTSLAVDDRVSTGKDPVVHRPASVMLEGEPREIARPASFKRRSPHACGAEWPPVRKAVGLRGLRRAARATVAARPAFHGVVQAANGSSIAGQSIAATRHALSSVTPTAKRQLQRGRRHRSGTLDPPSLLPPRQIAGSPGTTPRPRRFSSESQDRAWRLPCSSQALRLQASGC